VPVEAQLIVPVQVSSTVSPSRVVDAEIAALTVAAEQSEGPTVMVAACALAAVEISAKLIRIALLTPSLLAVLQILS